MLREESWLESKRIEGGTASARVSEQIGAAREALRGIESELSRQRP